jgi:hypothetical protein
MLPVMYRSNLPLHLGCGYIFERLLVWFQTKWFGHGAHSAWFNNFKIPFGSSIRVTVQSTDGTQHGGY